MNKNQLANKIWASANKMRSKIEANEYKDYILGFIFYKFLSDKEIAYLKDNGIEGEELEGVTEDDTEVAGWIQDNLGYFISYNNLFSTWLEMGKGFAIDNVRDALSAFDRKISPNHKKLFDGIFETLQTGLSKLGSNAGEQSTAVRDLVSLIKDIPTDGRQDYDVLGFVYEYLISNFAANAGKKAGEFYTPHEVSVMMSDIIAYHLRSQDKIRIYDPTSGSGSLLINIGKSVAHHIDNKDNIMYYAQELKQNTFNLTRMNLIMRGIKPSNIEVRNGDTLKEDWPYFDETDPQSTYEPLYVDAVVSNPPYSQEWDSADQENDPRYAQFGIAPKKCADFAFLLHDLYHVKPHGIMTIVLPHGVLYRGGSEYQIRKQLIEYNHIDAIIGLPEKVFFGTGISTIVMVLKRPETRPDTQVLFVDASHGFAKEGKNNKLRACDIKKIVDAVTRRDETQDYARLVTREDLRANDYNLNISRYVDGSKKPEKYDIYATMFGGIPAHEMAELRSYWKTFPSLQSELFSTNSEGYSHLKADNVRKVIERNAEVRLYIQSFMQKFYARKRIASEVDDRLYHHAMAAEPQAPYTGSRDGFGDFLEKVLIGPMLTLNISQCEETISTELFHRLAAVPLIDRYQAFQFFSDDWTQITIDLEILQTEGMDAVRAVDPNMVITKDNEETQEGWIGRVLPFDLVQRELLSDELDAVNRLQSRLDEITDRYTQIIENLSVEDLEKSILNDENTKFVSKEVNAEVKQIQNHIDTPEISLLRTFPTKKKEQTDFIDVHSDLPWHRVERNKSGSYGKSQVNALITLLREEFTFPEDSYEAMIMEVSSLLKEEKAKKDELKDRQNGLLDNTIKTIKGIDDDTAVSLLRTKWVKPLLSSIERMPDEVFNELSIKIQHLSDKYATTYHDITTRISRAENNLYELIGELEGNTADEMGLKAFRNTLSKDINTH